MVKKSIKFMSITKEKQKMGTTIQYFLNFIIIKALKRVIHGSFSREETYKLKQKVSILVASF